MDKKEMTKETMQEQIKILADCKTKREVIAVAKARGHELTAEQAKEILSAVSSGELSDEQLDQVAGGYFYYFPEG